jgi:hypothetical protein
MSLVIGSSQSGLAADRSLQAYGMTPVVPEASPEPREGAEGRCASVHRAADAAQMSKASRVSSALPLTGPPSGP